MKHIPTLIAALTLTACGTPSLDCNDRVYGCNSGVGNKAGTSTGAPSAPSKPSPSAPSAPSKPSPSKPDAGTKPGHGKGDNNHGHSGPPGKGKGGKGTGGKK